MAKFVKGDVVVIPFPFSDLTDEELEQLKIAEKEFEKGETILAKD